MGNIRVITDDASDLPGELFREAGVVSIPLDVRLGSEDPAELRVAPPEEFWRRAATSASLAETAAPSPGAFLEAFTQARADGFDGVCCVTISSALSATYQAARAGASELSDFPIQIIDSRFATMGEGLVVLEAAAAAGAGRNLEDVAKAATETVEKTSVFGTLDTLDYLRRGGRIGPAQAFFGSLLAIKPIIEVREGVVEGESRQRTRSRSLRYLADKVINAGALKRLAIVHAAATDLDAFLPLVKDVPSEYPTVVTFIGPVIGAHTGPGTVGVCFERA